MRYIDLICLAWFVWLGCMVITKLNPGKTGVTVTAQTYQNYKSALRWWHQYYIPQLDKGLYIWPPEVDRVLACALATYKWTLQ